MTSPPIQRLSLALTLLTVLAIDSVSAQPPDSLEAFRAGVVKIRNSSGAEGSGFIYAIDRGAKTACIVTAAHVVGEDANPQITFFLQDRPVAAKVLHKENIQQEGSDRGLAFLSVDQNVPPHVAVLKISDASLEGGDKVNVIGMPLGRPAWSIIEGRVEGQSGRDISLDGNIGKGVSGGPLIKNGEVLGVVTAVMSDISIAIPSVQIIILLKNNYCGGASLAAQSKAAVSYMMVNVTDTQDKPITGVMLITRGGRSEAKATDTEGRTRIQLGSRVRAGSIIGLQITEREDLIFISPWDGHVTIPKFESEEESVVRVVLSVRGVRDLLEDPRAALGMASELNRLRSSLGGEGERLSENMRRELLAEVAKGYGLTPAEVEQAIRNWARKAISPYERGVAALYARNYPEATIQLSRAIEEIRKEQEQKQNELVDAYFQRGQSHYVQGKYREAVNDFREADNLRPNDGDILNNLARALHRSGEYLKARIYLDHALKVNRNAPGGPKSELKVAMSLNNLANLYYDQGKYEEAFRLHKEALDIKERQLGTNHMEVALSLNNLANAFTELGKYDMAEPLLKKALDIVDANQGANQPEKAYFLSNLSVVYLHQSKPDEAMRLHKQAEAIMRVSLDTLHPDYAKLQNNLALIYYAQGDKELAEGPLKRAVEIKERQLGKDHPSLISSLHNLAIFYVTQLKYPEAERLIQRALAIFQSNDLAHHPHIARSHHTLAVLYYEQGKYKEAEAQFTEAISSLEKAFAQDHPVLADILDGYVRLLWKTGRLAKAEEMKKRADAIRRN
jgi:tetratricopeptide (TPR) repeat protein